jgi:hypothetical protein
MTKVLEYKEVRRGSLSSSGNTLVVREVDRLDIWDLSAKTARFIEDIYDVNEVTEVSCDDEYVAYDNKDGQLTVYFIATTQKHTLHKCHPFQIFKGSLYYGDTVAKLNDINATAKAIYVQLLHVMIL